MYNVQLSKVHHEYEQIKNSKDFQENQFCGKSKVATSTNCRWQGKKVVPVRRRCSRGEWNVGVVGVAFEARTMPICPGMSQYELEIFANQRIVMILPSTHIPTHICHVHHGVSYSSCSKCEEDMLGKELTQSLAWKKQKATCRKMSNDIVGSCKAVWDN